MPALNPITIAGGELSPVVNPPDSQRSGTSSKPWSPATTTITSYGGAARPKQLENEEDDYLRLTQAAFNTSGGVANATVRRSRRFNVVIDAFNGDINLTGSDHQGVFTPTKYN